MDKNPLFDKIISRIYTGVELLLTTFLSLVIAAIIPLWACYMERQGEKVDAYLNILYIILLIFTIVIAAVYLFLRGKEPPNQKFIENIQKMVDDCFRDVDSLNGKYKGNRIFVEKWKEQMRDRANNIINCYRKEGQTKKVWNDARNLDMDLSDGLDLVQDGKNPLTQSNTKSNNQVREL